MSAIETMNKEVLFTSMDSGWGREFPTTLITYEDGSMDLHRQTGHDFESAIDRAKTILAERGLDVMPVSMIGPTGAYMTVEKRV